MMNAAARRFSALPTAAKLLLILSVALLPIGVALMWLAQSSIRQANQALAARATDHAQTSAESIGSLIGRNALALRVAANAALAAGPQGACERAQRALSIAPSAARHFQLHDGDGKMICAVGQNAISATLPLVAPADIRIRVTDDQSALALRVGVIGGMATARLPLEEIRNAAQQRGADISSLTVDDGERRLDIVGGGPADGSDRAVTRNKWPIGHDRLTAEVSERAPRVSVLDRLFLSLPLLMWVMAALVTWLLVTRLLIRPLRALGRSVVEWQPGTGAAALPSRLGPATEIQELRDAFARALGQVEHSKREMSAALDGQRRLVREVHHRVKNNLQVVASLLNIHGRSAATPEASAAYSAIARRVGALSIVHRNHFAEMEENRGIALRPLVAELTAELRAGAPESARRLAIDLDVDPAYTTQDAAVSAAFLITEMVEFAMLNCPDEPVEVSLRRTSELTARLTMGSPVLVPDDDQLPHKVQFERIVGGLAKQLRSNLDRKLGRYSVEIPVFPAS